MTSQTDRERGQIARRSFLSTLAHRASLIAGGAAAALAACPRLSALVARPLPAAEEPPGRASALRLSTSTVHWAKLSLEAACERIAKLGFRGVDIWASFGECHHLDDALKRLPPDGLKALLEKHKLELNAFSVYTEGYPKYAEYLGKVGGGLAVFGSAPPVEPVDLVPKMKAFLEGLKPQMDLAEKYGSRIAIENHGDALLHTLDSLKAFTDLNRSPRVGIALAPYHIQAGKMSVEEAIRICGKQLFFFYAWQDAPGTGQLPGLGPTDFTPWIEALVKAGYEGYLNAFMHGDLEPDAMSRALAKSKEYLEGCQMRAKAR